METAGSEQTSSAIMLWAKTRVYVYVVGGRVGMNDTCYPEDQSRLKKEGVDYFCFVG